MRITRPQLAKIWATAKDLGLDSDAVRDMTPAGSVGMLTVAQASELIDALLKGRAPDYTTKNTKAHEEGRTAQHPLRDLRALRGESPRPRASAGIIRLPSPEAALLDSSNITWLAEHWRHKDGTGWTELQVLAWLGTRRFKHGGPMNVCRSARDLADRIEFTKGLITRTKARDGNRQARSAVQDYRDRVASAPRGRRDSTTKNTKEHEGMLFPLRALRDLRGEQSPSATECHHAVTQ